MGCGCASVCVSGGGCLMLCCSCVMFCSCAFMMKYLLSELSTFWGFMAHPLQHDCLCLTSDSDGCQ